MTIRRSGPVRPWDVLKAVMDIRGPGTTVNRKELEAVLVTSERTLYRRTGTPEWQGWVKDGTVEVKEWSNRGDPCAWRFVGPLPDEPEVCQ